MVYGTLLTLRQVDIYVDPPALVMGNQEASTTLCWPGSCVAGFLFSFTLGSSLFVSSSTRTTVIYCNIMLINEYNRFCPQRPSGRRQSLSSCSQLVSLVLPGIIHTIP